MKTKLLTVEEWGKSIGISRRQAYYSARRLAEDERCIVEGHILILEGTPRPEKRTPGRKYIPDPRD